jgi:hypothetical protein
MNIIIKYEVIKYEVIKYEVIKYEVMEYGYEILNYPPQDLQPFLALLPKSIVILAGIL